MRTFCIYVLLTSVIILLKQNAARTNITKYLDKTILLALFNQNRYTTIILILAIIFLLLYSKLKMEVSIQTENKKKNQRLPSEEEEEEQYDQFDPNEDKEK